MGFFEVREVVFASHGRGEYRLGLDAIDAYQGATPDEVSDLAYWRMCSLSRLDEPEEVCAEFVRRLDEGYWWSQVILTDPDFDNVRTVPEWKRLTSISLERATAASLEQRHPIDITPKGDVTDTLVLLHGAGSHPRFMVERYRCALDWGCRLLALHGPEAMASHRFAWPTVDAERVALSQLDEAGDPKRPIHGSRCWRRSRRQPSRRWGIWRRLPHQPEALRRPRSSTTTATRYAARTEHPSFG